jgi:hypothetical protein
MQNLNFRVLVALVLLIICVAAIVLAGVMGLGKKIGAPGLDTLVSRAIERFVDRAGTGPFPETTLPENISSIAGTWSGISDKDGTEWRFTFERNYAVRVSNSKGYYRQGTAFVHWKLGLTDGNVRVPPGWSILDMDIIQSSEPSHRNIVSLGAYSRRGTRLEYCFSEPGRMVRPITNESREEISCFELTESKSGGNVSADREISGAARHYSPSDSYSAPQHRSGSRRTRQTENIIDVTNFHARILVKDDGAFTVHETMRIFTNGVTFGPRKNPRLISGLYRSISSRIQGQHAYYRRMAFRMISAAIDGTRIPYSVETTGSWFTNYIFLGPDGLTLSPGVHEVTLEYTTDRHINFLPDQDEFFWWVFGEGNHGWATSVGKVEITVVLPEGGHGIIASLDDYSWNKGTGKIPELLRQAAESGETNVLHYNKVVSEKHPYLSVVVGMPKGTVHEPDLSKRMEFFFRDMIAYLPGIIGLTVFVLYYIIIWVRVGRDPKGKSIVPRYKPPADCSPAFARLISTMGYDRTGFASALLDLASKGVIRILRHGDAYAIEKTKTDTGISPDEQVLYNALFGEEREQTSSSKSKTLDAVTIHRAYRAHRRHLMSSVGNRFFLRNARYVIPGVIISLVVAAINAEIVHVEGGYVKELTGLALWTVFAGFVCRFLSRKNVLKLKKPSRLIYLLLLFPAVLYSIAVSISHAFEVFNIMKFMFLAPLFMMLTAHVVFLFLLRAPTPLGRKILDEIEGFRTYLAAAEGDRLDRMTPPEKTPNLFREYLPYALALGVENRWSEKFSGQIDETYTLPPLDVFLSILARLFTSHR